MDHEDAEQAPIGRFTVGEWLVEPALARICRRDEVRHVEPKVMGVLVELARSAGEVVSKAELTDAVWRLPFVSDNRLTGVIADLRRALDDDAADPHYVQSIPTRGYRLVGPVAWGGDEPIPQRRSRESSFKLETTDRGYPLSEGVNIIGRGVEADVRIDSEWVSRRHACVVVEGVRALLEDLGSKNGTHLNGAPVTGQVPLNDGDEIRLGKGVVVLRFVLALGTTRTEAGPSPGDL